MSKSKQTEYTAEGQRNINLRRDLTIIPWARVGYEMVNSQRGAKRRVGYNQSHIQQARME